MSPSRQPNAPAEPLPETQETLPVIRRNIEALLARRQAEERNLPWQERMATRITEFTGSMTFVYIHVVLVGLWILINVGAIPGMPRFDPSLVVLAMVASVEAIFLSTFILITQRRMMAQADRRADLTLQISLLSEHEITRLLATTMEMARRMGIGDAVHPDMEQLAQDVPPEQVLEQLKQQEDRLSAGKAPSVRS